jgi:hypothetical protein
MVLSPREKDHFTPNIFCSQLLTCWFFFGYLNMLVIATLFGRFYFQLLCFPFSIASVK